MKEVLKFYSNGCNPCKQYAPTFEKVKQELSETINFFEVNVDEDTQSLTTEYKVKGIPCTVIVVNGLEVAKQSGSLTEEQLKQFILIN